MKHEFELLKKDTEVVLNGILTKIVPGKIIRPSWSYDGDDERETAATEGSFYDSLGDLMYMLDVSKMEPEMVDWEHDMVCIDTSDVPSYLRDINETQFLSNLFDTGRELSDLSKEDLIDIRKHIVIGSMYLSDFNNDKGIERGYLMSECESFLEDQIEKYGDSEYENHLTAEEFADAFLVSA